MIKSVDFNGEHYQWNSEDLMASKQAVCMLAYAGLSEDEIFALDAEGYFGNLDVLAVLEEDGYYA